MASRRSTKKNKSKIIREIRNYSVVEYIGSLGKMKSKPIMCIVYTRHLTVTSYTDSIKGES